MPGRVQRQAHAMVFDHFTVVQRLQLDAGTQPLAKRARAVGVRQVVCMADASMVRMRVRDHGTIHRPPGVDVEVARRAVQAFGAGNDEVGGSGCHGVRMSVCRKSPGMAAVVPCRPLRNSGGAAEPNYDLLRPFRSLQGIT
jgi:hypothetical protein